MKMSKKDTRGGRTGEQLRNEKQEKEEIEKWRRAEEWGRLE